MVVVKLVMGRSGEERVLKGVVVVVLGVRYLEQNCQYRGPVPEIRCMGRGLGDGVVW